METAPTQKGRLSTFVKLLGQLVAAVLAFVLADLIHYEIHPLTSINTVGGALVVAFSYLPGVLIGYLVIWIEQKAGEDDPDVPVAAVICGLLWFVYLFRALTLLVGLPGLSNWTQAPAELLVRILEWLDPVKLGQWFSGLV